MSEVETPQVREVRTLEELYRNVNTRLGIRVNEEFALTIKHKPGKFGSKFVITIWRTVLVQRSWLIQARTRPIGNIVVYSKEAVENVLTKLFKLDLSKLE
jgi:hypothetical protein